MAGSDGDYSDSDSGEQWLLGFVKPVPTAQLLRHRFPSKAGGRPAWLHPIDLPHEDQLRCGVCKGFMDFLLQIYAPISGNDGTFHRMIYLFISPKGTAISQKGGCKAFRCQLGRKNAFYSFQPPTTKDTTPPKLPEECVVHDKWQVAKYEQDIENFKDTRKLKLYPEYEISIDEEGPESECHSSKLQEKIQNYQHVKSDAAEMAMLKEVEGVLTQEQKTFAEFEARVSRAPAQCIRYCFEEGAEPIWPNVAKRPTHEDIPNCENCGAKRKFEFQVLPQMIHYLKVDAEDPDAPDWGSIAVYSCSKSCTQTGAASGSKAYLEEFVWVQPP